MKYRLFSLLLLLGTVSSVAGQTYWRQTSGPPGGLITALAVDSIGRAYVSTAAGGIFITTNEGQSWEPRNDGLGSLHIGNVQASNSIFLYAVTYQHGLYKYSENDKSAWSRVWADTDFSLIQSIAVNLKGTLFVGTARDGILRSTNHGNSFQFMTPNFKGRDRGVKMLTVGNTMSAGETTPVLLAGTDSGNVYRSHDDGDHWTLIPPPPGVAAISALVQSVNDNGDGYVLIGDANGAAYRLSIANGIDSGVWQKVYQHPVNAGIYSMSRSPKNGRLYLWNLEGFCYRSSDEGRNWLQVDSIASGGDFYPMVISEDGIIYVGTDFEGAKSSHDEGETFQPINKGLNANLMTAITANSKGDLYAMSEVLVFRSTNKGTDWDLLDVDLGESLNDFPMTIDNLNNVYVGTQAGVLETTDDGETWKNVFLAKPPYQTNLTTSLFALPTGAANGNVFAGTERGLYVSTNYGRTWLPVGGTTAPQLDDANVTNIVLGKDNTLYATSITGELYQSKNASYGFGDGWRKVNTGGISIAGLRIVGADGTLIRIVNRKLLISHDTAQSWQQLDPAMSDSGYVFSIMFDDRDQLVASTDTGVYISTNMGKSWMNFSGGLHDASNNRLESVSAVCQTPDHAYYAATRGAGVFKSNPYFSVSPRRAKLQPGEIDLAQNYPNPFNPSTTIRFELTEPGKTTLTVFDMMGRKVATLLDAREKQPGTYEIRFDASGLPSGVYSYELVSGATRVTRRMQLMK